MPKRTFTDAERDHILSQYLGGGTSADSSSRADAVTQSMRELAAAVADARVTDGEGNGLTTEYGVTVTAGAALGEAKDIFRNALATSLSQQGLEVEGEGADELAKMGDKLIDASFDAGLRTLNREQANAALDGLHEGVATAALSLAVNDLQGIQQGPGPAALASGSAELTLQVLQVAAERMNETQLSGIQAVEGLQPTLEALASVNAPTPAQAEVLTSVEGLGERVISALGKSEAGADPMALPDLAQEVRDLAAQARDAFGGKADSLATSLGAFADAIDKGDVGLAQGYFAESFQGGRDLATQTLRDFVESSGPGLQQAQDQLDVFAPSAVEGMGKLAALVNETGRDGEDLGGLLAVAGANLNAVMAAAKERGDDFLADLDSLSSYREVALDALAQRTVAAQARETGTAEAIQTHSVTFDDEPHSRPAVDAEGPGHSRGDKAPDAESGRGEPQAEMEMAL